MEANLRTLDALFNSQLRYVVPMLQRRYVWQEAPQWISLWCNPLVFPDHSEVEG